MRIRERDQAVSIAAFDEIAAEYYDSNRHPTCANFRFASSLLLSRWLDDYRGEPLCEVGCGKSVVAEILSQQDRPLTDILLTDDSAAMLDYSRVWTACGAQLKVAGADTIPVESRSLRYLISCLGDPYNNRSFWKEAVRVLRAGGQVFFTTPANDWASAFRQANDRYEAEFELADGRYIPIPSYIYSESDQIQLIEETGLRVVAVATIVIKDLAGQRLSTKLLENRGPEAGVVAGFAARRL
jgi:ubiquinone/menaquinone biosynthesis C-methylase UbiE